jgi:hypothetical protein
VLSLKLHRNSNLSKKYRADSFVIDISNSKLSAPLLAFFLNAGGIG